MTGVATHQRSPAGMHLMACAIALYFIVQGLGLALTESGDWGMGWVPLGGARPATSWFLGLIAACGVLTAALAARVMARRDRWAPRASARRLSLAFVATVFGGTLLRPPLFEYGAGLVLTASIYAVELLLLVTIAVSIPQETAALAGARLAQARPWLPWLLAAWTLGMAIVLGSVVFERMPHVPDEVAYLFQAKSFASGRLFLPPPPDANRLRAPAYADHRQVVQHLSAGLACRARPRSHGWSALAREPVARRIGRPAAAPRGGGALLDEHRRSGGGAPGRITDVPSHVGRLDVAPARAGAGARGDRWGSMGGRGRPVRHSHPGRGGVGRPRLDASVRGRARRGCSRPSRRRHGGPGKQMAARPVRRGGDCRRRRAASIQPRPDRPRLLRSDRQVLRRALLPRRQSSGVR